MYCYDIETEQEQRLVEGPVTCTVEGTVYKVKKSTYGYQLYMKNLSVGKGRAVGYSSCACDIGDRIWAEGELSLFDSPANPGEFDTKLYYQSLNIKYKFNISKIAVISANSNPVYKIAGYVSQRLQKVYQSVTDDESASVFIAMLLGNKDELDKDIQELFTSGGIGHILAISGLHISLIGMGLYKIIRKSGLGYVPAMIVSTALICFYGVMTGNGISTIRALIMFIVAAYANVVGRTYDILSAVSLSMIITLAGSPMLIYNCGFLLSYGAIYGIVFVGGALNKLFPTRKKWLSGLYSSLAIQIMTLPITLYFYYQVPVLSVLLNMIVIPLMTVVMISVVSCGLAGLFTVSAARFLIGPAVYILKFYEWLCSLNMRIPWSTYTAGRPQIWQIALYYAIVFAFIRLCNRYGRKKLAFILATAVACVVIKFNRGFKVVFLSVGQGDCIYVRTDNGKSILIDGGSTDNKKVYEYTIEPFLLSQGVDSLDYVIVTHCDNDHISGIKDMLEEDRIDVNMMFLPSTTMVDESYEEMIMLAGMAGTKADYIYSGVTIHEGETYFECIHPSYMYDTNDKNSYSTTLIVKYNDFKMLLSGDIGAKQEMTLIDRIKAEAPFSVYKAAHHGSKFSNCEELLNVMMPENVVISCGIDNSYGHPHEETLKRLETVMTSIYRTDRCGAVIIEIKKDDVVVRGLF